MPLGSSKIGLYKDHLGGAGTAFVRSITITPTISNHDSAATYGTGYKNKVVYGISSNIPNATVNYTLNNASNSMFANGVVSGSFTFDGNGDASLTYDMNVWANYANTSTDINLSIINPNGNSTLATGGNITLAPANTFTANSSNASTLNDHTVHIFDSYETIENSTFSSAKVWDDLQVTSVGDTADPFNYVTAIVVGGGGAGGPNRFGTDLSFGNIVASGGGGGSGDVIYYKAPANVYSAGNISITLGDGGRHSFQGGMSNANYSAIPTPSSTNKPMGGNTVFGFHETQSTLTAHGGVAPPSFLRASDLNSSTSSNFTFPSVNFDIGLGGFKANANVDWTTPLGGSGATNVNITFDLSTSLMNAGYLSEGFGNAGLSQANITNVGASSEIYIAKAPGNVTSTSSRIGASGNGVAKNWHGSQGGVAGNTTVFETATIGEKAPFYQKPFGQPGSWNRLHDTSGVKVPQPLPQAGNVRAGGGSVTYWNLGGGGASAPTGGGSRSTSGNLSYDEGLTLVNGAGGSQLNSTGNANTSFSVEPAARVTNTANASYTYHGLRGGGGSGGPFLSNEYGTNGGEGIIIVYYPTEYMSFTS